MAAVAPVSWRGGSASSVIAGILGTPPPRARRGTRRTSVRSRAIVREPVHETSPTIHVLARPAVDVDGMRRYLDDVGGAPWRAAGLGGGGVTRGGGLGECVGRTCYRSWARGLVPVVRRVRAVQAG